MVDIHNKIFFLTFLYSLEYQSIANTKVQSKQTKPQKKRNKRKKEKKRKRHTNNT